MAATSMPTPCATVLAEAARLEDEKRDFPGAMALLKEHLAAHPECVEAYVHLAADSGILRNFADAEKYARDGLAIDPASGRAHYYLGCALRSQGRLEDALREMEWALVLIKRMAARGTLAEAAGIDLPLYGWNLNVESDVMALRIHLKLHPLKPWDGAAVGAVVQGWRTHEHQRLGFALDLPADWSLVTAPPPWGVRMMARLQGVPLPDASVVEFICGSEESLNVSVMTLGADMPPDVNELMMTLEAQNLEFTDPVFGRIIVGGREHATARYVAWGRVHSKKYQLVFGGRGYALTAASPDAERAAAHEGLWDAIAGTFRLLPWAAAEAARFTPHPRQSMMIDRLTEELEMRLERRAVGGVLYGRGYEAAAEGDYSTARKLLERCLADDPDHVLAHKELAIIYEKQGDLRRALEHRRAVHRLNPEDAINESRLKELERRLGTRL